jgi:CheY-like chemotaxis protein
MNNRTILLVEDNPKDEMLTLRSLEKCHVVNQVVVVRDGAEALDYLFGSGDYVDRDLNDLPTVVILDLKLPRVSGHEVLLRIRADERYKLLPVVILTSSDEEQDILAGYELGANSYVRKPVAFADFSRAVADLGRYWLLTNEPPPKGKD